MTFYLNPDWDQPTNQPTKDVSVLYCTVLSVQLSKTRLFRSLSSTYLPI